MRVYGTTQKQDVEVDTAFSFVVDVSGAKSVTVSLVEGRASVIFRGDESEIAVYLTRPQLDKLVTMWDQPSKIKGGLPLAYFWKETP